MEKKFRQTEVVRGFLTYGALTEQRQSEPSVHMRRFGRFAVI